MASSVLQVENLTKRYGDVEALRGVSFAVEEGEVFGLLGPNGAGKTSTVEILEGLRTPDSGRASVCGLDPQRSGAEFKHVIGAALQRSEEHTSELQSQSNLVCRLLLEKKKQNTTMLRDPVQPAYQCAATANSII